MHTGTQCTFKATVISLSLASSRLVDITICHFSKHNQCAGWLAGTFQCRVCGFSALTAAVSSLFYSHQLELTLDDDDCVCCSQRKRRETLILILARGLAADTLIKATYQVIHSVAFVNCAQSCALCLLKWEKKVHLNAKKEKEGETNGVPSPAVVHTCRPLFMCQCRTGLKREEIIRERERERVQKMIVDLKSARVQPD